MMKVVSSFSLEILFVRAEDSRFLFEYLLLFTRETTDQREVHVRIQLCTYYSICTVFTNEIHNNKDTLHHSLLLTGEGFHIRIMSSSTDEKLLVIL